MAETYEQAGITYAENIPYNGSGSSPAPGGGGYLPEMLYVTRPRKVDEDEAIPMMLISLLDEAW